MTDNIVKEKYMWIKYIKLKKNNMGSFLKVMIYYDIGHYSYLLNEQFDRGYYIGVNPVDKGVAYEISGMFNGECMLIQKTNRFNQKIANEIFDKNMDHKFIQYYLDKYGLEKE